MKQIHNKNDGKQVNNALENRANGCFKCNSLDQARFLSVYLDKSYLDKCEKHRVGRCESCVILFDLAQIISEHQKQLLRKQILTNTTDKFCLKCSIDHVLKAKKVEEIIHLLVLLKKIKLVNTFLFCKDILFQLPTRVVQK